MAGSVGVSLRVWVGRSVGMSMQVCSSVVVKTLSRQNGTGREKKVGRRRVCVSPYVCINVSEEECGNRPWDAERVRKTDE